MTCPCTWERCHPLCKCVVHEADGGFSPGAQDCTRCCTWGTLEERETRARRLANLEKLAAERDEWEREARERTKAIVAIATGSSDEISILRVKLGMMRDAYDTALENAAMELDQKGHIAPAGEGQHVWYRAASLVREMRTDLGGSASVMRKMEKLDELGGIIVWSDGHEHHFHPTSTLREVEAEVARLMRERTDHAALLAEVEALRAHSSKSAREQDEAIALGAEQMDHLVQTTCETLGADNDMLREVLRDCWAAVHRGQALSNSYFCEANQSPPAMGTILISRIKEALKDGEPDLVKTILEKMEGGRMHRYEEAIRARDDAREAHTKAMTAHERRITELERENLRMRDDASNLLKRLFKQGRVENHGHRPNALLRVTGCDECMEINLLATSVGVDLD
jgi:hypothetical protein